MKTDEAYEVTKEKWIIAERIAGFNPKGVPFNSPGYMETCATGGFSDGVITGTISEEVINERNKI